MFELPKPSSSELAQSQRVVQHIKQLIQTAGGVISFADYMQAALYAPGLGYYVAGKVKLGEQGDFVTAPEISANFSYCLAKQAQQVLATLVKPIILEFGAGSGIMAADILAYLAEHDSLPDHYWILETSPDLQQLQKKTLRAKCPDLMSRVQWLNQLPCEKFSGVILANEVLDAMPVQRFYYDGDSYQTLSVVAEFAYQKTEITDLELQQALAQLPRENFSLGYESEINLWLTPWLKSISDILAQGLVLLIDYGYPRAEYYHPDRSQGTLRCHYRHLAHEDAFFYPGIQDITAHVDFTAVAEAADAAQLEVSGYCHQAAFLLSCGIDQMPVKSNQDQQLIMPQAMGEIFKVMALTRDVDQELLGFSLLDQRGKL